MSRSPECQVARQESRATVARLVTGTGFDPMTPDTFHNAYLGSLVADAVAMPVHWYYNPHDIEKAFPGGIMGFEAAPGYHPASIMSLHSTSKGGRGAPMRPGRAGMHRQRLADGRTGN